jgi:hypothetical protein
MAYQASPLKKTKLHGTYRHRSLRSPFRGNKRVSSSVKSGWCGCKVNAVGGRTRAQFNEPKLSGITNCERLAQFFR